MRYSPSPQFSQASVEIVAINDPLPAVPGNDMRFETHTPQMVQHRKVCHGCINSAS
jgi:hypothetical protein